MLKPGDINKDGCEIEQDGDVTCGYWIKTDVATYRCSVCGKKQIADDSNELNFCCCCGSRNRSIVRARP